MNLALLICLPTLTKELKKYLIESILLKLEIEICFIDINKSYIENCSEVKRILNMIVNNGILNNKIDLDQWLWMRTEIYKAKRKQSCTVSTKRKLLGIIQSLQNFNSIYLDAIAYQGYTKFKIQELRKAQA